jgi:hypothetical protein
LKTEKELLNILFCYSYREKDMKNEIIESILELPLTKLDISGNNAEDIISYVKNKTYLKYIILNCHGDGSTDIAVGSNLKLQLQPNTPSGASCLIRYLAYDLDLKVLILSCHAGQLSGINWNNNNEINAKIKNNLYVIKTKYALSFDKCNQILLDICFSGKFEDSIREVSDQHGSDWNTFKMWQRNGKNEKYQGSARFQYFLENSFVDLEDFPDERNFATDNIGT